MHISGEPNVDAQEGHVASIHKWDSPPKKAICMGREGTRIGEWAIRDQGTKGKVIKGTDPGIQGVYKEPTKTLEERRVASGQQSYP